MNTHSKFLNPAQQDVVIKDLASADAATAFAAKKVDIAVTYEPY